MLALAPLPLCDGMQAVLVRNSTIETIACRHLATHADPSPLTTTSQAAVPSAGLDAWVASGGRRPGQSAAEALALEEAMQTVHASSAALQSAAHDAERAAEALLNTLRRCAAVGDGPSDSPVAADAASGSQPHGDAAPATQQAEQGGTVADALDGISSEVLHGCYRQITWGQWIAMCVTTATSLAREAQLRHAMSEALLHATPPGAGGEDELCVELCDSLAQLWRLQPHVDDALLRALVMATQGE